VFGRWVQVHFDGACEAAPGGGLATYGFVVEGEELDHQESGLAVPPWTERATNNVAEYTAAIRALEYLRSHAYNGGVLIAGDSQLVVRQMLGDYQVRADHLKAYHDHLEALAAGFTEVRWTWVPREQNQRADELSKEALELERPSAKAHRAHPGPKAGGTVRTADR
jgi:ribonuclease HI